MRRLTRSLSPAQNNVAIPGKPSLPNALRTVQPNVTAQPWDVYAASPWRGPGTAPVQGSGCGIGGGSKVPYLNGGGVPRVPAGPGREVPPAARQARRMEARRDGRRGVGDRGQPWRRLLVSPVPGSRGSGVDVTEACFQSHQLDFAGTTSDILFANGTRVSIPLTTTRIGTYPEGSQWARNPIPGCYLCDAYETCGPTLAPVSGIPSKDACAAVTTEANCKATNATFDSKCAWRAGYGCQLPPDACKGPATVASCEAKKDAAGHQCQWITQGSYASHR